MFFHKRQITHLTIGLGVSIAIAVSFSTPGGRCANTQSPPRAPAGKQTPQEILDQIPGVKFKKNLPDNFPVPKYPSHITQTNFVYSTKGVPSASATIITSDSVEKVFDWYQSACKGAGWQIKVPTIDALAKTSTRPQIFMIQGTRPKEQLSMFCTALKKKPGTTISISWTKTP
ncbi:MAG: hypothetical protein P4L53_19650 [Candidatus Obscuribacterales bacterium]|nr:hypothetical protein [Candidatus Obscuribacterales bacterium]